MTALLLVGHLVERDAWIDASAQDDGRRAERRRLAAAPVVR